MSDTRFTEVRTPDGTWCIVPWKAYLMSTNGGPSWFRRLFARSKTAPLDPARSDLVVVAWSFDDAESASSALDRAASVGGWNSAAETVFRHHLVLPVDTVEDAAGIASQDGYERPERPFPVANVPDGGYRMHVADAVEVTLQRVQVIDALHISQERSRMAGLAQRRGGIVMGWDALQPQAASQPDTARGHGAD